MIASNSLTVKLAREPTNSGYKMKTPRIKNQKLVAETFIRAYERYLKNKESQKSDDKKPMDAE
jgi:hypothetical protein